MPSGIHQEIINLPIDVVWSFVKDMDNWAPLVPGYIQHEKLSESLSTWEFKSDIGILKKKVSLLVEIKEWKAPTRVSFDLTGVSDKYAGGGYFEAEAMGKNTTKITGFLDVTASGAMGKMVNSLLKTTIPKSAEEMGTSMAARLKETYKN
jgi:carbon monoxide dehydrogenase subunit G